MLWSRVAEEYDLDPVERTHLAAAARQLDVVTALEALVAEDGVTTATAAGGTKLHPAVAEARQARVALTKLLGAIRLPAGEAQNLTAAGVRAQHAARARWGDAPRGRDRHGRATGASS
ncbi:MAG: P27 family phage terminase small subunit [Iamia sp.]